MSFINIYNHFFYSELLKNYLELFMIYDFNFKMYYLFTYSNSKSPYYHLLKSLKLFMIYGFIFKFVSYHNLFFDFESKSIHYHFIINFMNFNLKLKYYYFIKSSVILIIIFHSKIFMIIQLFY